MVFITSKFGLAACVVCAGLWPALGLPGQALADKAPADYSRLAFDSDKRKKTKSVLTRRLSYSGSYGVGHLSESNRKLDDGIRDRSAETKATVDFALRLHISDDVKAFNRFGLAHKKKFTHSRSYPSMSKFRVKEAHLSFALPDNRKLTFGRMRFSDPAKWMLDASVDGVHISRKSPARAWEAAVFQDVFNGRGAYAFAHTQRSEKTKISGASALLEFLDGKERLHLSGYHTVKSKKRGGYNLYAAAVVGDAANGRSSGYAIDANMTRKFPSMRWKPQLSAGFALASEGYLQSDLASNKARDGGQAQFNRFGSVFRPELSNLAVVTLAAGLRPSRKFSVDLRAHLYAQTKASTTAPVARISGTTTGRFNHIGHEISLVGAWRPNKKSKIEFGAGMFKPGRAYNDRSLSRRMHVRFTRYF